MAVQDLGTAQSLMVLDLQRVAKDIELTQNQDSELEKLFPMASAQEMSLQNYRQGIQWSSGGHTSFGSMDGAFLERGQGPGYSEFIVAPVVVQTHGTMTELAQWIGKGGAEVSVVNPETRLVGMMKTKHAHSRSILLQGYNNGVLGTVDPSYTGTNVVQMQNLPYGARGLDINEKYAITDANLNIIDTVWVQDKQSGGIGTGDTATIDHVPVGMASGYNFTFTGLASGTPLSLQGLQYIVSPANTGDYDSQDRAQSWVQCPALSAGNGTLTMGTIEVFDVRKQQLIGKANQKGSADTVWYTHTAQRSSAYILGFAKSTFMLSGDKTVNYDIGAQTEGGWKIGNKAVVDESIAALNYLYALRKPGLRAVRYPNSQKFLQTEGDSGGIWFRRMGNSGGNILSGTEFDCHYVDSTNYFAKVPWWNGVITSLGINAAYADAI